MVHDAAPAFAEHALAVGVVHHQQQVVFLRHLVDLVQRCHVAVHAEDAVGHDQRAAVLRQVGLDLFIQ
jgi:hypothetical protein